MVDHQTSSSSSRVNTTAVNYINETSQRQPSLLPTLHADDELCNGNGCYIIEPGVRLESKDEDESSVLDE